jgi:hypothetical protein
LRAPTVQRSYGVKRCAEPGADADHPAVVENYRQAHEISSRSARGEATTEDLRQAMQNYRALFEELLADGAADAPIARDTETESDADQPATSESSRAAATGRTRPRSR